MRDKVQDWEDQFAEIAVEALRKVDRIDCPAGARIMGLTVIMDEFADRLEQLEEEQ